MEIINITYGPEDEGGRIIYTTATSLIGLSDDEFNKVVTEAKKRISWRPYILDRFEHWEVPGSSSRNVKALLMSRARNEEEKQTVEQYISTWGE